MNTAVAIATIVGAIVAVITFIVAIITFLYKWERKETSREQVKSWLVMGVVAVVVIAGLAWVITYMITDRVRENKAYEPVPTASSSSIVSSAPAPPPTSSSPLSAAPTTPNSAEPLHFTSPLPNAEVKRQPDNLSFSLRRHGIDLIMREQQHQE
jgi:cytoskeletal protein RodZ